MSFKIYIVLNLYNSGCGGALKPWEEKDHSVNESVTTVFVEQPLALPRSANLVSMLDLLLVVPSNQKVTKP